MATGSAGSSFVDVEHDSELQQPKERPALPIESEASASSSKASSSVEAKMDPAATKEGEVKLDSDYLRGYVGEYSRL